MNNIISCNQEIEEMIDLEEDCYFSLCEPKITTEDIVEAV